MKRKNVASKMKKNEKFLKIACYFNKKCNFVS